MAKRIPPLGYTPPPLHRLHTTKARLVIGKEWSFKSPPPREVEKRTDTKEEKRMERNVSLRCSKERTAVFMWMKKGDYHHLLTLIIIIVIVWCVIITVAQEEKRSIRRSRE